MKKFRTIMVTVLAMLMVLFCFASCGKTGKYEAVAYTIGGWKKEVEETDDLSYIELKKDNVATVSISLGTLSWSGDGTWKESEEKENTVLITVGILTYEAVVEGGTMTLNMGIGSVELKK